MAGYPLTKRQMHVDAAIAKAVGGFSKTVSLTAFAINKPVIEAIQNTDARFETGAIEDDLDLKIG